MVPVCGGKCTGHVAAGGDIKHCVLSVAKPSIEAGTVALTQMIMITWRCAMYVTTGITWHPITPHPFLSTVQAQFRKEEVGDLLALRYDDIPETTGNDKASRSTDVVYVSAPDEDPRHPKGTMQVCWDGGVFMGHDAGGLGGGQGVPGFA